MTNAIMKFLAERKSAREKKPEKRTQDEIDKEFDLRTWISSAAKRARQLTIVTHPGKFGHPDANITAIKSDSIARSPDGYLRTGNVPNVPDDVFGNAAALDIYAFLSLTLDDGRTVLSHLKVKSPEIQNILNENDETFGELCSGLLAIEMDDGPLRTDGKIKQVYFPVPDSSASNRYHLLSILTPSGLVYIHRERIRATKFSDETKSAREARKSDSHSETGYKDFLNLLTVSYGGSQPQNVSRLNSSNSGEAIMLPCLPPFLDEKYVRLPKKDFFAELRWDDELKSLIESVHRIFVIEYNNVNIRDARKYWFTKIFNWIFSSAMRYQSLEPGWSQRPEVQIPLAQRQWLDPDSHPETGNSSPWRDEIVEAVIRWILAAYRRIASKLGDTVILGEVEESRFQSELNHYLDENKESVL
jgi:CRISPR-associated protein Csy1